MTLPGGLVRRWHKRDWIEIATVYGIILGITGLAIYLRHVAVLVGWLWFAVGLLVVSVVTLLIWIVLVFPIALLVGWIFRGEEYITDRDPDGPSVIV